MNSTEFHRMLDKCPIFAAAPAKAAVSLAVNLERRVYQPKTPVYAEGDPGDRMFIIASGQVMLTRTACDREGRLVLGLRGPAEIFGEVDFLDDSPRVTSAVARSELTVLAMNRRRLRSWIRNHPDVGHALLRLLARDQRHSYEKLTHLRCADLPSRLALSLLQRWKLQGTTEQGVCTVDLGLNQKELAQMIGASRDQTNKMLSHFRHRGWIRIEGRTLFILAPEQLTKFATQR
ncbi:Crp/Fnr family transcriptional regulator [Crossiella sp. SN42]|uniref:Crp/Fnr family transcriptional regulator n=1 Tax=Crossiella sp. SN42 TaxID=2944808 RepID=UPI00207CBE79|nr:Crp/Fnr family transcriptional regulator [Crossiella sp. SN42]MCO1580490.1 Crp/Fnr family transcriptional regulator [Crossiella sp. SN42]